MSEESKTHLFKSPGAQPEPEPCAELVVLEGALAGTRIRLESPITCLGRRADNDLVLPSSSVSKAHGRISLEAGSYFIEDLESTNGIQVNNRRLDRSEQHRLYHGDTLRISEYLILFNNPRPLVDHNGLSTISFDVAQVRAEAAALLEELPDLEALRRSKDS